ncbi:MAG: hypothetical protein IPP42_01540 [Saprospiraceae bacterium]|nr:hypothetical protein [Saprospiraceae bacterium]
MRLIFMLLLKYAYRCPLLYFWVLILLKLISRCTKLIEVESLSVENNTSSPPKMRHLKQVQERTAELKRKNSDLEIEAALDKIRSRSLTMHKSEN